MSGNAVEVEGVVADAPGDGALLVTRLIRLALDARIHDVVPANRTVVYVDVPGPQSNCIPFFDFENHLLLVHANTFHVIHGQSSIAR